MSLNRYGLLYQQYLKQNKPMLYDSFEKSNQLINIIQKKQDEILKYRNSLYECATKDKIFDKSKYDNEDDYEFAIKEYVEKQLNDKLNEFFEKDVKVITLIEKSENNWFKSVWGWLKLKELILAISIVVMSLYNTGQVNIIEENIIQPILDERADFFMLKNGIQYYYKGKDKEAVEIVEELLGELPENVLVGVKEIHFEGKNGNVLGSASGTIIKLYDFMNYDPNTQKDTLYHEVRTHFW